VEDRLLVEVMSALRVRFARKGFLARVAFLLFIDAPRSQSIRE